MNNPAGCPPPYSAESGKAVGYPAQPMPQPMPQPVGYPVQPGGPIVQAGPSVVMMPPLGPEPISMTCSGCGSQITTRVEHFTTGKTHLFALLICLFGGGCGCCLIPYCVDSCMSATHSCPACRQTIGTWDN